MNLKLFYVGVKGIIISEDKALILKSARINDGSNDEWILPGGRINDDETIFETLNREIKEELPSIKSFEISKLIYTHRLNHNLKDGNGLVFIFFRVIADSFKVTLNSEHIDYKWVKSDQIDDLRMDEGYKKALKLALK